MYAIALVEALSKRGYAVQLELYGEGKERIVLEDYIEKNHLKSFIELKGNQSQEIIKSAYQNSHFVLLPSKSEGWPKAIAEGMFWGCIPLATSISCVPFMLDYGNRGVLLTARLEQDVDEIEAVLNDEIDYSRKRKQASYWSRNYTLDVFKKEIKRIIKKKMKKYLIGILFFGLIIIVAINNRTPFFQQKSGGWSIGYGSSKVYPKTMHVDQKAIYTIEALKAENDSTVFLADPFFVKEKDTFYLFFEHKKTKSNADIGLLTSTDGKNYVYRGTVLSQGFHLSYPQVFKYKNEF